MKSITIATVHNLVDGMSKKHLVLGRKCNVSCVDNNYHVHRERRLRHKGHNKVTSLHTFVSKLD